MGQKIPSPPKREGVIHDDLRAHRVIAGPLRRVKPVVVRRCELLDLGDVVQSQVVMPFQPVVSSLRPLQAALC